MSKQSNIATNNKNKYNVKTIVKNKPSKEALKSFFEHCLRATKGRS